MQDMKHIAGGSSIISKLTNSRRQSKRRFMVASKGTLKETIAEETAVREIWEETAFLRKTD